MLPYGVFVEKIEILLDIEALSTLNFQTPTMESLFLNHQVERVQHSLDQRIFREKTIFFKKNSNFSSNYGAQPAN